jgi:hypothetical protein
MSEVALWQEAVEREMDPWSDTRRRTANDNVCGF